MPSSMITTSSSSSDRSTASAAVAPLLLACTAGWDGTTGVTTPASLLLDGSAVSMGPLQDNSSVKGQMSLDNGGH